eukprot:29844-Pelagococcus_subviridis.AAC.3
MKQSICFRRVYPCISRTRFYYSRPFVVPPFARSPRPRERATRACSRRARLDTNATVAAART